MGIFSRNSTRAKSPSPTWALFRPLSTWSTGNALIKAIPAVGRCIDLLAGDVARLPVEVQAATPRGYVPINSGVPSLFERGPNDLLSGSAWRAKMVRDYLVHGEHLDIITRNGRGEAVELTPCEPGTWGFSWDPTTQKLSYQAFSSIYEPRDVLHFRRAEEVLFTGVGILDQYRTTLNGISNMYQAGERVFKVALPKLKLETEEPISSDGVAKLQEAFRSTHGDASSWSTPVIVSGGMKVGEISQRLDQSQWAEGLRQSILDVANMFGLPVSLIDNGSTATDEEMASYIENCLRPLLSSLEGEINLKLLEPETRFQFSTRNLSKGTVAQQAAAQRQLIDAGVQTPNEGRINLGLAPSDSEGMDEIYLSKNYANMTSPEADDVSVDVEAPDA